MIDRPVLRARFTLPDGTPLERDFTLDDLEREGGHPFERTVRDGPPDWLDEPRRAWDHPQDPVTFSGRVKPGREGDARKAVLG